MIICEPLGGLNNRTKCLLSAMRVDEDIKLVWAYKDSDVHLWCKFSDIFDMPFEEFRTMDECTKKYTHQRICLGSEYDLLRALRKVQF